MKCRWRHTGKSHPTASLQHHNGSSGVSTKTIINHCGVNECIDYLNTLYRSKVSRYSVRVRWIWHRNSVDTLKCRSAWKIFHAAWNDCSISSHTTSHPAILCHCFIHLQMVMFICCKSAGNERWLIVCWGSLGHRGHHSFPTPSKMNLPSGCMGFTAQQAVFCCPRHLCAWGDVNFWLFPR